MILVDGVAASDVGAAEHLWLEALGHEALGNLTPDKVHDESLRPQEGVVEQQDEAA